jgi:hypothetical protein
MVIGSPLDSAAIRPIADVEVLSLGLPLNGFLGECLVSVWARSWSLQRSLIGSGLSILRGRRRGWRVSADSVAQRVFGSAQLRNLGERLYRFLDGDERWLSRALADPRGAILRIAAEERLRHLPRELVVKDGSYLTVRESAPLLLPIRASSSIVTLAGEVTLFMATSPECVEPVLSYEADEAGILAATANTGTELVVEESGTLEGLRFTAESSGAGYFDVLHLSGNADIQDGQPTFPVENELGGLVLATADQLARARDGQWPRLVFVSDASRLAPR